MRRIASLVLVLSLLPAPAAARASKATIAPPGQSAIDQYLETVPGAGGSSGAGTKPKLTDPSVAARAEKAVPAATLRRLSHAGADGKAAAALAAAGAPDSGTGSAPAPAPDITSDGPVAVLRHTVTGTDGGIGAGLPLLLVGIVLGAAVVVLARRRGGGSSPA